MLTLDVNKLPDLIVNRVGLILYDNLYDLLHFDRTKAPEVFKTLIINSLVEYARQYPVQMKCWIMLGNGKYYFQDNFEAYKKGKITEDQIILHPTAIYFIKNGLSVNAQWWDYQINDASLICKYFTGKCYVEYCAQYPYVLNINDELYTKDDLAADKYFTEDSKLYYLDIDRDVAFLDYLIYYVIKHIRLIQGSLNLGTQVTFLAHLDQVFTEYEQLVTNHRNERSDILRMWRK